MMRCHLPEHECLRHQSNRVGELNTPNRVGAQNLGGQGMNRPVSDGGSASQSSRSWSVQPFKAAKVRHRVFPSLSEAAAGTFAMGAI